MRVLLDFAAGTTAVQFDPDTASVPLRRPLLVEWCGWQQRHEQLTATRFDLLAAPDDGPVELDDVGVAQLNHDMIVSLLVAPPPEPVGEEHPLWLAFTDRALTVELLTFWRDYPLSPWINSAPDAGEDTGERTLIRSTLPGVLGARAVLYKALAESLSPYQIDALELWQIAVLLHRDEGDPEAAPGEVLAGAQAVDGLDDGGRVVRSGNRETRSWRRKPGAPFLFSAPAN